jgi:hypothetical protein
MKIEQLKVLETETIGDVESIKATIDQDSMPFVFEMLSKNLYSNPIGSIVREITSNCFDSHTEAGVDEPVLIQKSHDVENNKSFIHFIDVGVGLSPDRMEKIYMKVFSSTKRNTDSQIGGYGLGSKSPLSYQDMFYINTVFNGIRYNYILSKGESVPNLDLIGESETTDHPGTEIKIEIKPGDTFKFETAILTQLTYFDNVYVSGFNINNSYKIFEGKYFKYRLSIFKDYLHVVFGKVTYSLDWKILNREPIDIPIAVKFEIGELLVTPSREELRYTDEIKELVNKRIDLCIKELQDIYTSQNPELTNIFEYLKIKDSKTYIKFDDEIKVYIPVKYGVKNNSIYAPLKHLPITIPDNPFFMYEGYMAISNGKGKVDSWSSLQFLKSSIDLYYNKHKTSNEIKNAFIVSGNVITNEQTTYETYCNKLNLYKYTRKFYSNEKYDYYVKDGRKIRQIPILGKAKIIKEYIDHIRSLINAIDYQKLEVPQEFIKEYRESRKAENQAYQRRLMGKVLVRNHANYKSEVSLLDLSKINILVYVMNDQDGRDKLKYIQNFLDIRFGTVSSKKSKVLFYRYIAVSQDVYRKVAKLPNAIHVDNVLNSSKIERNIRDFATAYHLQERIAPLTKLRYMMNRLRSDMYKRFKKVEDFKSKQYNYNIGSKLESQILEIAKNKNLVNLDITNTMNELDKFMNGLDIVNYLTGDIPDRLLIQIIKPYKKRLDWRLYSKPVSLMVKEVDSEIIPDPLEVSNNIDLLDLALL